MSKKILYVLIFVLLATISGRFSTVIYPDIFLSFFIPFIMLSKNSPLFLIFLSFLTGLVIDSINPMSSWIFALVVTVIT